MPYLHICPVRLQSKWILLHATDYDVSGKMEHFSHIGTALHDKGIHLDLVALCSLP
jgi:hypothetical protein